GFNREKCTKDSQALRLEETAGVRIVSSENLPLNTPYLTLSHRWGSPPVILLGTATLFLLRDDITPYLLRHSETATFRHAVYITRGLGYRYIWIDALCIMQDDESEKTEEIMQMDEIYSNSILNIAASEGRIHEGLLFNRNLEHINPCRATISISKGQAAHLLAFPDKCSSTDASLNERGWVFQERTLSPRICHFTKNQIFWECRSLKASEVLPEGTPDHALRSLSLGIDFSASVDQLKRRWYELAEQYSGTSLTFPNDRLLAISAVAKRLCLAMKLHPSDYLAGMWKDDLPQSLLWFQSTVLDAKRSTEGHPINIDEIEFACAPTWSWASILSSSSYVERTSQALIKTTLLDVSISRISSNFFDGARSCRLRLQGPVCKCRRQVSGGTPWIHVGQKTRFQEAKSFMFQHGDSIILEWDTSRKNVADFLEAGASSSTPSIFFLLHITSERSEDGPIERGIILQRSDARGTYVRVGSFMTTPLESTYAGSELEAAFNGILETLSIDDYIGRGPEGRCIIDLV
ncbi:heterokaryon incompatibility protein-domain-containing protein, partial [Nemania serpens]